MKYISWVLLLLQISSYGSGYAQINGNNDTTATGTEIRTRLLSGIVAPNYSIEDDISSWFINLNIRSSQPAGTSAKLAAAIEAGMNIWQSLLAPYFKAGPELKFSNNLYIDAHLGLVLPIYEGILLLPFGGLTFGCYFRASQNFVFELEGGINTTYIGSNAFGYLPYISAGFGYI